jgi:hypothetical protein
VKLPIIGILSGVALATLGLSGIAEAAIVIPPTGLAPGSEYRLVFVTSGTRNATSSNIDIYNTFVQNAARSSSVLNTALTAAGFDPTSITWTAIASTGAVNARANTRTRATDTSPIYRLDGAQVAPGYGDLWGRDSIGEPINRTQEDTVIERSRVWTGTGGGGETSNPLGVFVDFNPRFGLIERGDLWVSAGIALQSAERFYGISSVLVVPTAPTTTTPEPSSLLGFITLGGTMLGTTVRKARK